MLGRPDPGTLGHEHPMNVDLICEGFAERAAITNTRTELYRKYLCLTSREIQPFEVRALADEYGESRIQQDKTKYRYRNGKKAGLMTHVLSNTEFYRFVTVTQGLDPIYQRPTAPLPAPVARKQLFKITDEDFAREASAALAGRCTIDGRRAFRDELLGIPHVKLALQARLAAKSASELALIEASYGS